MGIIYLIAQPPRGKPVNLLPPPTPEPILVHVIGAVVQPGLYSLTPGSRVQNAIEAAGGCASNADPQSLNLAALLEDGQQLLVPWLLATPAPGEPVSQATEPVSLNLPQRTVPTSVLTTGLININTASQEELETLPGIGPVTAQKIIIYRETYGPFTTIESIQEVNGIGPVKFAGIKELIIVGGNP